MKPDITQAKTLLFQLQGSPRQQSDVIDDAPFIGDAWQRGSGGGGRSRVLRDGNVSEQTGVNFSHVRGGAMSASTTTHRSKLVGRSSGTMGVPLVVHPLNPYIPTSRANVQFSIAGKPGADPVWWLDGGFNLTPHYGFEEDAAHWHYIACDLCPPFGEKIYPRYKKWYDDHLHLKYRQEQYDIDGLFLDDPNTPDFDHCFVFMRAVGNDYADAYLPIVERQKATPYGEREHHFQFYRRGRYVEFNLVWDRGTLSGLQTDGHTESVLMSMLPLMR